MIFESKSDSNGNCEIPFDKIINGFLKLEKNGYNDNIIELF